jgi:hypothetical protein
VTLPLPNLHASNADMKIATTGLAKIGDDTPHPTSRQDHHPSEGRNSRRQPTTLGPDQVTTFTDRLHGQGLSALLVDHELALTQVKVERHPPIEVQDSQVTVDEHQRGQLSPWLGLADHSSLKPPRPGNAIKQ